jgi:hypothetical protein
MKIFTKNIRRFSILHNKPKVNKPESKQTQQIINNICYVDYDIKFNDGLFLLAENPNKSNRIKEIFVIGLSINLILADLRTLWMLLLFYVYKRTSLYSFNKPKFGEICEIYLTKESDKLIIRYTYSGLYKLCNIKNIKLLDENEFNSNNSNKKHISVKIDGKTKYIPSDLIIHNRELFCAVFNGYEVRHFDKSGYIKLKTNDKINYYV